MVLGRAGGIVVCEVCGVKVGSVCDHVVREVVRGLSDDRNGAGWSYAACYLAAEVVEGYACPVATVDLFLVGLVESAIAADSGHTLKIGEREILGNT